MSTLLIIIIINQGRYYDNNVLDWSASGATSDKTTTYIHQRQRPQRTGVSQLITQSHLKTSGQIWKMRTNCTRAIRKHPQQYISYRVTANKHVQFDCSKLQLWVQPELRMQLQTCVKSQLPPSSCLIMLPVVTLLPALPYLPSASLRSQWLCSEVSHEVVGDQKSGPAMPFLLVCLTPRWYQQSSFFLFPSEECALLKMFHFKVLLHSTIAQYPKVANSKGENQEEENSQVQGHFPQLLHHKVELLPWKCECVASPPPAYIHQTAHGSVHRDLCKHSVWGHLKNNKPHRDIFHCCLMW